MFLGTPSCTAVPHALQCQTRCQTEACILSLSHFTALDTRSNNVSALDYRYLINTLSLALDQHGSAPIPISTDKFDQMVRIRARMQRGYKEAYLANMTTGFMRGGDTCTTWPSRALGEEFRVLRVRHARSLGSEFTVYTRARWQ